MPEVIDAEAMKIPPPPPRPPRPELWAVVYYKAQNNVWFTCSEMTEKSARERSEKDSDACFIVRIPAEQPSAPAPEKCPECGGTIADEVGPYSKRKVCVVCRKPSQPKEWKGESHA